MSRKVLLWNLPLVLAVSIPVSFLSAYPHSSVDGSSNAIVNQSARENTSVTLPNTLAELRQLTPEQIATVPKYDGRKYNIVTDVEYQTYDICWSYGFAAASETSILREGDLTSLDHTNLDIEELKIDDDTNIRTLNDDLLGLNGYDTFRKQTRTGRNYNAAARIANQGRGPYLTRDGESKPVAHLENIIQYAPISGRYNWNNPQEILNIKKLIAQYGGVEITYNSQWQHSKTYFNSSDSKRENHAVLVVGWDDNIPKERYANGDSPISTMNGGWIVKNSWGIGRGENGFFYLSYDSPIWDVIALDYGPNNSYDNNYYWDGYDNKGNYKSSFITNKYASIFPAKKASYNNRELLNQISFGISGKEVDVVAKIYKNVESDEGNRTSNKNQPESGTLVDTITNHYDYPGFYTLKLHKPVELNPGEYFSVVIETTSQRANTDDVGITFSIETESLNDLTFYQDTNNNWINTSAYGENKVAQIRAQTSNSPIANQPISNDLQYADVRIVGSDIKKYRYQDGQLPPNVSVTFDGKLLTENVDYTVSVEEPTLNPPTSAGSDSDLVGSGNIRISGIGNYSGTKLMHYPIMIGLRPDVSSFGRYENNNEAIVIDAGDAIHSFGDIKLPPGWRFTGTDSLLQPGANTNWLTYTGSDANCFRNTSFSATVNKTGSVSTKKLISLATVTLDKQTFTYTGDQHKPVVTSVTLDGTVLKENTDYQVKYENNTDASSSAIVIVHGIGEYTGIKETLFTIQKAQNTISGFNIVDGKPVVDDVRFGNVKFKYFTDRQCTQEVPNKEILEPGTYYVKAYVQETKNYLGFETEAIELVLKSPTVPNYDGSNNQQNQNQSSNGLDKPDNAKNTINPALIAVITVVSIVTVGTIAGIGFWFGKRQKAK